MDPISRHDKKPSYYAYPDVVQPVLFFDFSVRDIHSGQAAVGVHPNSTNAAVPLYINYTPNTNIGEPPTRSRSASEFVLARYQWTWRGLQGFDIGGK